MEDDKDNERANSPLARPQQFCLQLVRFMSTISMDPHLYFEQKLTAQIAAAESQEDIDRVLSGLVDWIASIDLTAAQINRLDSKLAALALPSFSLMQDGVNRELGGILARGAVRSAGELRLLRARAASDDELLAADAALVAGLIAAHDTRG